MDETAKAYFEIFPCMISGKSATYVSAPVTSGVRFFEVAKKEGLPLRPEFLSSIKEENRKAASTVVERLRSTNNFPVINPTALVDLDHWEQADYYKFWTEVIKRFCDRILLINGWEYSNGCSLEAATAYEYALDVFDQDGRRLTARSAAALLAEAAQEIGSAGLDNRILHRSLMSIEGRALLE
ncbi:MAG TPA: DUF4406 domain-containing protein [Fimbriimonadaceae bacterium]|jgi:hypothetical protein